MVKVRRGLLVKVRRDPLVCVNVHLYSVHCAVFLCDRAAGYGAYSSLRQMAMGCLTCVFQLNYLEEDEAGVELE